MYRVITSLLVAALIVGALVLNACSVISGALASALIGGLIPLAGVLWMIDYTQRQFREQRREDQQKREMERSLPQDMLRETQSEKNAGS